MTDPFVLYADCEVKYKGRAESSLARGNYLIIYKADGSLLVHGSTKSTPRNYQGSGTKLEHNNNTIICRRKSEEIRIEIYNQIYSQRLLQWADNEVVMRKTEKELVLKLYNNWEQYFTNLKSLHIEYPTELGNVDFVGIDQDDVHHIVEAKRVTASLAHCSQLKRYLEYFEDKKIKANGYILSPKINKRALQYLNKHNCKHIKMDFDE